MNDIQIGDRVIVNANGCEFPALVLEDGSQPVPLGGDPTKPLVVQDRNGDTLDVSRDQIQLVK